MSLESLKIVDPDVYDAVINETEREKNKILLIASENYASQAVLEAQGSVFTNKYAEGYPGRRYYGGCEFADQVEDLAIQRARELFGAEHINVQPHSGTQANMAVYFSVLKPGDTVLGMNLNHGGHLSHGASVNFSGFLYNPVTYGVNKDGYIDMDEVRDLARRHRPGLIITGASAYSRIIDFRAFADIAKETGAACRYCPHCRTYCRRSTSLTISPLRFCHNNHPQDPQGSPWRDDYVQIRFCKKNR